MDDSVVIATDRDEQQGAQPALDCGVALRVLLARRSVSPRRLGGRGPTASELHVMLLAALRAPDHGALRPWRLIEFPPAARAALADLFEAEKLTRDPLTSTLDRARARDHATRPPQMLAFVVSPVAGAVPIVEQWLSAGAALGNLLNAAHMLGYGAIILSGARVASPILRTALKLAAGEHLAGFIAVGGVDREPPPAPPADSSRQVSTWSPGELLPMSRPNLKLPRVAT